MPKVIRQLCPKCESTRDFWSQLRRPTHCATIRDAQRYLISHLWWHQINRNSKQHLHKQQVTNFQDYEYSARVTKKRAIQWNSSELPDLLEHASCDVPGACAAARQAVPLTVRSPPAPTCTAPAQSSYTDKQHTYFSEQTAGRVTGYSGLQHVSLLRELARHSQFWNKISTKLSQSADGKFSTKLVVIYLTRYDQSLGISGWQTKKKMT